MLVDMAADPISGGRTPAAWAMSQHPADASIPDNACRSVAVKRGSTWGKYWEWASVNAGGPWCFVEEADFLAAGEAELSSAPDGPGGQGMADDELRSRQLAPPCGNLRRLPCDVPQCAPPAACVSATKPGPMLVANGGFEDWRRPSGQWRQESPARQKFPDAKPLDVMHWEYAPWTLKMGQWGAGVPATLPFASYTRTWPGWRESTAVTRQGRRLDVLF
jgi:hypothetical protein